MQQNVETFIGCEASYQKARLVLFGAGFDSTTSYRPGARFGPSAMRHESYGIETYSPYLDKDLLDYDIFDAGNLDLPFGDTNMVLDAIEDKTKTIVSDGKLPVLLGGEHLVTLGSLRHLVRVYPDLHILHFDAHADLRNDYLGVKLSHACVMRRAYELLGDGRIHQFVIRSGDKEEFTFAKQHTDFHPFSFDGLKACIESLKQTQVPTYVTIDLDCLDPSIFCGTGTPEAGGVSFKELQMAIASLHGLHIVGADLNELAPTLDPSGVSTAVACKTLRELLLSILD